MSYSDGNGHGTHVAGTAAAKDDLNGVVGVAPGASGNAGSCTDGGMRQAICRSTATRITYAVAAGNESVDANTRVPAAYPEVITVSALADFNGQPGGGAPATCRADVDDTFADFSNYGSPVDIIAPGVCTLSTWRGGGYNTISGTSMASPHVAGAAGLYKSTDPTASPSAVKSALQGAGNLGWDVATDRGSAHEVLLNVDAF